MEYIISEYRGALGKEFLSWQQRPTSLMMADRKPKKKPKQSAATDFTAAQSAGAPKNQKKPASIANRRVDPNINVSMRKQIMLAKMLKQAEKSSKPGYRKQKVERTGYRKEKLSELEMVERLKAQKQREKEEASRLPPTLLVDGYNVIMQWQQMKSRMERDEADVARAMLLDALTELKYFRGWDVVCVFDGQGGPQAASLTVERTGQDVEVVYTGGGFSADGYIETKVRELGREGCREVLVATNDNMIKGVATAHGGVTMSAGRCVTEMKTARRAASAAAADLSEKGALFGRMQESMDEDTLRYFQELEERDFLRDYNEEFIKKQDKGVQILMRNRYEYLMSKYNIEYEGKGPEIPSPITRQKQRKKRIVSSPSPPQKKTRRKVIVVEDNDEEGNHDDQIRLGNSLS